MILIDADAVGSVTYDRLVRDGVVVPATRRFAFPADVNPSPGIRAWCVAPSVPTHTVLSGLAGLWVWHGGSWPGEVTVVGKRGLHRAAVNHHPGPARDRVTFHSGLAWRDPATTLGPIAIASPARCCSDALRWDAHRVAIPVVARTVATGAVPLASIIAEVRRDNLRGAGYARLAQLWRVLYPVLEGIDVTPQDGRHTALRSLPTERPESNRRQITHDRAVAR